VNERQYVRRFLAQAPIPFRVRLPRVRIDEFDGRDI
jgi:hypothetical protein